MTLKVFGLVTCSITAFSYVSLTLLNPTLSDYQRSILVSAAEQEAERFAAADRRAIEQEAIRLTSEFVAARYNPHLLDAARIERNHPILGASLSRQNESEGRTLTENLSISKEQALRRVAATREAMRSGILVDLTVRTKRLSYGIWSNYSTCLEKMALSYTGIAGRFYERTENDCQASAAYP
jgi:hypothetical protein